MATIARISGQEGILKNPYEIDDASLIQEAEDITISITTISNGVYSYYQDYYKAKQYGNDYFAILSRVGIGDQDKPTTKMHYLEHVDSLDETIRDLWADNVCVIEDFRTNDGANRIYLSFHCFCQGLGRTSKDGLKSVFQGIKNVVGTILPAFFPFANLANEASDGVKSLLSKLDDIPSEVKKIDFSLFPHLNNSSYSGDAALQSGSYVLFFEEVNIDGLYLNKDGTISSTQDEEIKPYLVVNIKKGKYLSPQQLNTSSAISVLSKYKTGLIGDSPDQKASPEYFKALEELGRSHRLTNKLKRIIELKSKKTANLSSTEAAKLIELGIEVKELIAKI